MIEYKGYVGKVAFDADAEHFHGEVINTRDVITFQGKTVAGLKRAFRASVEDYLAFCAKRGESPEKPFSGHFAARIPPELHRRISLAANLAEMSLNAWIVEQLQAGIRGVEAVPAKRKSKARKSTAKL